MKSKSNPENIKPGDWVRAEKGWSRNYKVTRVVNGEVYVLCYDGEESWCSYNIVALGIKKVKGPEVKSLKRKKSICSSNPQGLRKGQWVSKKHWESAFQISRVKNGIAYIIYEEKEFGVPYYLNPTNPAYVGKFVIVNPKTTKKKLCK